ncbi:MAG: ATP-binding cassette domain-containing protein [Armatimonadetes bacterium]|nr:ATP-binding cassette domain-containing protein [Armatimonadota bacterium]
MLELKGVSKSYGQTVALRATDLAIEPGKTTVLIGPSGCGKSTILRLMIGLIRPDTGTVYIGGDELTAENALQVRRRLGYVIQEGGLFPHLTSSANVSLMSTHLRRPKQQVEDRIRELAELVQLPMDTLDRYPAQLSGGQRQRVSLMRALMLDPDVLLLDEPLGALDPMIRAGLQEDLKPIFQTLKKTVVMVTHDIGEAGFFADTIVLMREGRIVQCGTLDDLVKRSVEQFVTDFINAQRTLIQALEGSSG